MRTVNFLPVVLSLCFIAGLQAEASPAPQAAQSQAAASEIDALRKEIAQLKEQNKRIIEKLKTAHLTSDGGNLLPVFVGKQKELLGKNSTLRESIEKSKVTSVEEASRVAIQHQIKEVGGLGAQQSWSVTNLFKLGGEIAGFAKNGDLIWEVRIGRNFGPPQIGVNQVIWVNSANGKARSLIPVSKKTSVAPASITSDREFASQNRTRSETELPASTNWLQFLKASDDELPLDVTLKMAALKRATINTIDDARAVMGTFYFEATGDLTLKDTVEVTDLFLLGTDVKGFAKKGDLVWHARVIKHGTGVVLAGWISSSTGQLRLTSLEQPVKTGRKRPTIDHLQPEHLERTRPNI